MNSDSTASPNTTAREAWNFAGIAVRLCATWLLVGALFKLFKANPGDLPKPFVALSPFGLVTTFVFAISVELAVVAFAYLRPKLGWIPLVLTFVFFEILLAQLIASGAKSCGCMGGAVTIAPALMATIDGALLLLVIAAQPWKHTPKPNLGFVATAIVALACAAYPWFQLHAELVYDPNQTNPTPVAGTPTTGEPAPSPRFIVIHPDQWVGTSIFEVNELTVHMEPGDADKLPTDGYVVLWRQSCEHCRDHLREMANDKAKNDGTKPIVLVQIQDDLKNASAVDAMPQGPHVTKIALRPGPEFAIQTPWEIVVEGGMVTAALDEEHAKALQEKQ